MALEVTSAIVSSPTSSLNCIVDIPKLPLSVHTRPSKSSISNSTNNLLPPPLSSYLPMSPTSFKLISANVSHLLEAHICQCLPPKSTVNIFPPTLSTSHAIDQNDPFIWERTFRGRVQGHNTSESRHEIQHSLTSPCVKI